MPIKRLGYWMFNLERLERVVIIFLIFGILLGLGVIAYRKLHSSVNVEIKNFRIEDEYKSDVDEYIDTSSVVNINEAGIEDLMRLKGIGPITARRILDYRSGKGRFSSKEEIKNVDGIGYKLFEKIKDYIAVE